MMQSDFKPYGRAVTVFGVAGVVFLLLPILVLFYYSIQQGVYFRVVPDGFGLKWFRTALSNDRFIQAATRSLMIAAIVTPVSICLALPTAFVLVRRQFIGKPIFNALIMSPLLVPGVVTGVAFLTLFEAIHLYDGITRTTIAMICFTFPFAVRALAANLHGLGVVWEEAAISLGASKPFLWIHVLLPMLRPGLLASAIFVFVEAIDNFTITVFLVGQRSATLPVEIFNYIADFDDPSVAAISVCLIIFSTVLMVIVERIIGFEKLVRYG